jgi:hypothetical protein
MIGNMSIVERPVYSSTNVVKKCECHPVHKLRGKSYDTCSRRVSASSKVDLVRIMNIKLERYSSNSICRDCLPHGPVPLV